MIILWYRKHCTCQNDYHKKRLDIISAGECVEKQNPCTQLIGMWIGSANMENSLKVPRKTKNVTTIWPDTSASEHLPK